MYRLIDTHAHLDEMEDLDRVLAEAREGGLVAIVAVGSDLESNKKVLQLATLHGKFVYPAHGLPRNISEGQRKRVYLKPGGRYEVATRRGGSEERE